MSVRLTDRIAESLQALIRDQGLQPGDRLTAERQLAEQLGVSRPSLRQAIQKLAAQGVLYTRRGGGTYLQARVDAWSTEALVAPLTELALDDPQYRYDVLEARHAIEGSTAWHAALRATDEDKARLQAAFEATLRFSDSEDPDLAAEADAHFHLTIAEASHNVVLLQTMRGLFDLLRATVTRSRQRMYTAPHTFDELTHQHRALTQAIIAGDAGRARELVCRHLEFVRETVRSLDDAQARRERLARLPSSSLQNP